MVRTRFAPSPTGYLHIGGVRTALYNWLFARQHSGRFILRIDDTDAGRNVEAALEPILHGFRWLGIDWDEGPEAGGEYGPYFQSQRSELYRSAVAELLARGAAYRDYATPDELEAERQEARAAGVQFVYSRRWAAESEADVARFERDGRRGVVRLRMPRKGFCRFTDRVRGEVEFEWAREQDHVIQRPDGSCLYHLASAVDDHHMGITHVIRAEEHLSNTPRHIFIAESLGYPLPEYAHLPYVAEPGSKTKLSKRKLDKYLKIPEFAQRHAHGLGIAEQTGLETAADTFNPVIVDFYEQVGYLPDALLNYLLLLGWSLDDKTELFSREEMVASFSLERVQKSPASFDPQKLWAFQDQHMQRLPAEERLERVLPFLGAAGALGSPPAETDRARAAEILEAAGDRIKTAGDILDYADFFTADGELPIDEKAFAKRVVKPPQALGHLLALRQRLAAAEDFSVAAIEDLVRGYVEERGIKLGAVIHALRLAVTGKPVGFGLFEAMAILGKKSCLARIGRAIGKARRAGASPEGRAPAPPAAVDEAGAAASAASQDTSGEGRKSEATDGGPSHFIRAIIEEDLAAGRHDRIRTRFPPEPNGYLHIGHAKAICVDFGLAADFGGSCNLRFDDTNPLKEKDEYVDSIKQDIRWLGFDWEDREYYASDYFEQLYEFAVTLVKKGKAYVDDQTAEEIRANRGTLTEPGRESPYRDRPVAENLDLLERMRAGEFTDGSRVLRAKIDMAAGNLNLRDPVMYRILHANHYRRGNDWCIYPTYDFTHGQSDSIEEITHSLCTLEFEDHRPLYDWFIRELGIYPSRQIEFARLNITYTLMSKRLLLRLVEEGHVSGWDDPRMPTLSGLRRRGYTPEAIRDFCDRIGVAKAASVVEVEHLEHCLRQDLNRRAPRVMAVLRPLKVVITNYPEDGEEWLEAVNNPEDEAAGTRRVPFSRELWIERHDFMEEAPKKFFRLAPGREVRLRWGYFIRCEEVIKDDAGEIVELRCTYDPETRGGYAPDGRKVRGTIHWVSALHALTAEARLYEHLFTKENPTEAGPGEDFTANLNPSSLEIVADCRVEPSLADAAPGTGVQFERVGYFSVDRDSTPDRLVFNRTVSLRDTWAKIQKSRSG